MSNTPRTDKAVRESNGQWSFELRMLCIELETELAEAREQRDTLVEALREIKESEPANHNGELFYPRYSPDGDWIGDEPVNPFSLLAFIYPRAWEALAAVKGGYND